jgi:hypothetical protein
LFGDPCGVKPARTPVCFPAFADEADNETVCSAGLPTLGRPPGRDRSPNTPSLQRASARFPPRLFTLGCPLRTLPDFPRLTTVVLREERWRLHRAALRVKGFLHSLAKQVANLLRGLHIAYHSVV